MPRSMPAGLRLSQGVLLLVLSLAASMLAVVGNAAAQTPGAPAITSVTAGDGSLTVVWTAPTGSTVTSYDLRHIETDEDETVDANWTEETAVWTSGDLEHTLGGLDGEVGYDVQMRAVNAGTAGSWSATSTGTPLIGVPTIDSVLVGDGALTVYWSPPPHADKVTIASYDLRHIATSEDETVDANWTVETGIWTSGTRVEVLDGLTNGTGYDVQVRAATTSAAAWSATSEGTPAEHGATLADATTMTLGTRVGGEIAPGTDADYFRFVLTRSAGVLIFTDAEFDSAGILLDQDGTPIKTNDDGYLAHGIRNFLIWDSLPAGTYYIEVTSYEEDTGSYVLFATGITDSTARSNAQAIEVGTPRNGILDPIDDVDWFSFTLAEANDVSLRSSSLVAFELQDSAGQAIDTVIFNLPGRGFKDLATLEAGTYYIKVTKNWLLPGLYSLYVLDAVDPGSTRGTAVELDFGRMAVGTIDPNTDTDYFRIDLEEDSHVELFAKGDEVRVHGELQDSSGNAVSDAQLFSAFNGPVGFSMLEDLDAGTHYLKVTGSSDLPGRPDTGPYAVLMFEDAIYADFVDGCETIPTTLSDPLSGCQWHLINSGQHKGTPGEDINVEDAWTTTMGAGVNVAVVDDGLQYNHPDLRDNVDTSLNWDYTGRNDIYNLARSHGTAVAGLIAARDNGIGVRGVAPRATIYGYNLLRRHNDVNEADAMYRNAAVTAVSSNSWGPGDNPLPSRAPDSWERAVKSGLTDGYGGKGTVYVWAAGNGADDGDYSTLDEHANHYGVIAACAVNDYGKRTYYSEMGANLWVCAPSNDRLRPRITTTDTLSRYRGSFGGTSAAAPQVSGVAALIRGVDTSLTWRDVKLILAASARKNDLGNTGWQTGALEYGSTTENYEFNHEYGFGVVDAEAAVDLAGDWDNVPDMRTTGPVTNTAPRTISAGGSASSAITLDSDIDFVEFVEVNADFAAPDFRDLEVKLVSPSGRESLLSVPESGCPHRLFVFANLAINCALRGNFRFGSAQHLGEDPSGRWTLQMSDRLSGGPSNRLNSWSITVYGHKSTPGRRR